MNERKYKVPFKTPADYFADLLGGDPSKINDMKAAIEARPDWRGYDCDLHVYPYVDAVPAALSFGCKNTCSFCPSAALHKGKVHVGDHRYILPQYDGQNVHFMDEDFFANPHIHDVIAVLLDRKIKWLAMTTAKNFDWALTEFGSDALSRAGLVCVEIGLENVVLMNKVHRAFDELRGVIEVYYLNMSLMPGETKETIGKNGLWMRGRGLRRPIHMNNGLWYAPGQFFHPYDKKMVECLGSWMDGHLARVRPSWCPNSLLSEDARIVDLEMTNLYSQMVYGIKMFPKNREFNIGDFVGEDPMKLCWLMVGLRTGYIE